MCSYIVAKTDVTGSAKAAGAWAPITGAVVSVDHPSHATLDHALIDRLRPGRAPGERAGCPGVERRVGARVDHVHAERARRVCGGGRVGPEGIVPSDVFASAAYLSVCSPTSPACVLDAVAPRHCAGCDAISRDPICSDCTAQLAAMPVPRPRADR